MGQNRVNYIADKFKMDTGIDVRSDEKAMARLKEAAEMAKIEHSTSTAMHVSLPYLTAVAGESRHLELISILSCKCTPGCYQCKQDKNYTT